MSALGINITNKNPQIKQPRCGWKKNEWYLVECSTGSFTFEGLLYTGCFYTSVDNPFKYYSIIKREGGRSFIPFSTFRYVKHIKKLCPSRRNTKKQENYYEQHNTTS